MQPFAVKAGLLCLMARCATCSQTPDFAGMVPKVCRNACTSTTLIAAQLPLDHWHEAIGDPTLADAILDRLIHNAHKITLKGESMRKARALKGDGPRD